MSERLQTDADFLEAPFKHGYIRTTILYLLSLGDLDLEQYIAGNFANSFGFMFNYIGNAELEVIVASIFRLCSDLIPNFRGRKQDDPKVNFYMIAAYLENFRLPVESALSFFERENAKGATIANTDFLLSEASEHLMRS